MQPKKRKDIFFYFIKTSHRAKTCKPDFKCFKCDGRNNVAVCFLLTGNP